MITIINLFHRTKVTNANATSVLTNTLHDLRMVRASLLTISRSPKKSVATGHIKDLINAEFYDELMVSNIRYAKLFKYSTSQLPVRYVADNAVSIPKRYEVRALLKKVLHTQQELITIGSNLHTDDQLRLARIRVLQSEDLCKRMGIKPTLYARPEYIKQYLSDYIDDLGYILQK